MKSRKPIFLTTVALALALLATPGASQATAIEINSGPNIKTELLRAGNPAVTVSFSFTLPDTATGDGLFEIFAGGDLNNLTDLVVVMAGVQSLGALAFPINSANPALCDTNWPRLAARFPKPCLAECRRLQADGGDVEGRRNVTATNFGTAGLSYRRVCLLEEALDVQFDRRRGRLRSVHRQADFSYPSTTTTVPEPGSLAPPRPRPPRLVVFQNRARAGGEQAQ